MYGRRKVRFRGVPSKKIFLKFFSTGEKCRNFFVLKGHLCSQNSFGATGHFPKCGTSTSRCGTFAYWAKSLKGIDGRAPPGVEPVA